MKRIELNIKNEQLIEKYNELKSSYKVAEFFNVNPYAVKRILKECGVLRSKSQVAKDRSTFMVDLMISKRTIEWKTKISEKAKQRTGSSNPFYGKKHTKEVCKTLSKKAKERVGKRNPNYKHGNYKRRTRDYKISEFVPVRSEVFTRDNYTCKFCGIKGNDLHAHHLIPWWVCEEAYLDLDNLITTCKKCHLAVAHRGDYAKFNVTIISDNLILKYSLDRERLNELADFHN